MVLYLVLHHYKSQLISTYRSIKIFDSKLCDDIYAQIAQETQHILIRLDKAGVFKRKCGDYLCIRESFQKITNALKLKWNAQSSPPVLHTARLCAHGLVKVATNQCHPYELFQKSRYLNDPSLFIHFQSSVLALWQIKNTKEPKLIKDLSKKIYQNQRLSAKMLKDQLTWCVQMSPPQFQLCWPSVLYFFSTINQNH